MEMKGSPMSTETGGEGFASLPWCAERGHLARKESVHCSDPSVWPSILGVWNAGREEGRRVCLK